MGHELKNGREIVGGEILSAIGIENEVPLSSPMMNEGVVGVSIVISFFIRSQVGRINILDIKFFVCIKTGKLLKCLRRTFNIC